MDRLQELVFDESLFYLFWYLIVICNRRIPCKVHAEVDGEGGFSLAHDRRHTYGEATNTWPIL